MLAGDIVACTSHDLMGPVIRYAQRRAGMEHWDINHVAALHDSVGEDWTVYQAHVAGVSDDTLLSTITPRGRYFTIPFPDDEADRSLFLEYLAMPVGDEYSWLSIASCALDVLLPESVCLRRANTLICSGYIAIGLHFAGYRRLVNPPDIYTTFPAEIVGALRGK